MEGFTERIKELARKRTTIMLMVNLLLGRLPIPVSILPKTQNGIGTSGQLVDDLYRADQLLGEQPGPLPGEVTAAMRLVLRRAIALASAVPLAEQAHLEGLNAAAYFAAAEQLYTDLLEAIRPAEELLRG